MAGIAFLGAFNSMNPSQLNKKPVAWYYELAACYLPETKQYVNFNSMVSLDKPNVPEGSIRNLKPLYD